MTKKLQLILLASLVIILSLLVINQKKVVPDVDLQVTPTQQVSQNVKLLIDYGDGSSSNYEAELASQTAFDLLKAASDSQNLELDYQQYDFGVFVKSINGLESGPDKAWIYFVNGESATVGADQYQLKPGDLVEWNYMTPTEE
jgi:hypothetical protein